MIKDVFPTLCSPRNTSLNFLSGFPKSPPADMMEPEELPPLQPRDLPDRRCSNRLMKRVKGRAGAELSRPQQGRRRSKARGQDCSPQTGSRRHRLPAESPGTERGPRLGREGERCQKQPGVCSGFPRLVLFCSQHRARRVSGDAESGGAGAADVWNL